MMKYLLLCIFLLISLGLFAADNTELYLTSIGTFSGQTLYLTYYSISNLQDRYDLGDYDDTDALDEVEIYVKFAKQSSEALENLQNAGAVSGTDIGFINDMISAFNSLSSEANSLKSFINTQQQEHMDNFNKNKTEAWDKIDKLLKVSDQAAK